MVNSLVFLLIGLEIRLPQLAHGSLGSGLGHPSDADWSYCRSLWTTASDQATGSPVPFAGSIFFWGGLRGSLSIALALRLPASVPGRSNFIFMIFGVVLFSLLAQGLTVGTPSQVAEILGRRSRALIISIYLSCGKGGGCTFGKVQDDDDRSSGSGRFTGNS